jgi:hypothetical protein
MDKKTFTLICVIALLAGSVFYFWVHREPIVATLETQHSVQLTEGIKDTADTATARIYEQDTKVRTEVKYVYEQTRTRVNALLPDSVADGLNAELSIFRGMEAGTGGLDDD